MAQLAGHPGVYVEEFTPGAPIEGVGTSTAAFIGTAAKGPIGKPTLIQSWDAFVARFGGIITDGARSWLGPAVYGFFLNGGTTCYVLRIGSGVIASANIPSRQGGATPAPVFTATARQEGVTGNGLNVQIAESSRLASALRRTMPARNISAVAADNKTLTVDSNAGYAPGSVVTLTKAANTFGSTVASVTSTDTIVLQPAITGGVDYSGGTIGASGPLALQRAEASITAMPDQSTLTVDSTSGFAADDRVRLASGAATGDAVVKQVSDATTLVLSAPVVGAFSGGTVRTADLTAATKAFRVLAPTGLALNQALPQGSVVQIAGSATAIGVVDSAGGDRVTLIDAMGAAIDLSDPANLPILTSLEFDMIVSDPSVPTTETFPELSTNLRHPSYWAKVVQSTLVTIDAPPTPPSPAPPDPRPVAGTYTLGGGTADDRAAADAALIASPPAHLDLLKPYDDVNIVCVPGVTDASVQQAIITHCETMLDRVGVLDSKLGALPGNGIRDQFGDVRSAKGFAGLYYPWIRVRNPASGQLELWPPSGHVAGLYARSDTRRGVHKAPANEPIRGAIGIETRLTDAEQGPLNLMGVNVIRVFSGQSQPVLWGARTTAGDLDRNWQYVNIRRLFLYLEESIERGIRWAVFEPNDLALWQKLKRTIGEFLTRVWRDGALFGETADKAFYVRIDEALNPPSTRALGRLYIEVGVAPTYPAEFIVLRIGIWEGGSEVSES